MKSKIGLGGVERNKVQKEPWRGGSFFAAQEQKATLPSVFILIFLSCSPFCAGTHSFLALLAARNPLPHRVLGSNVLSMLAVSENKPKSSDRPNEESKKYATSVKTKERKNI